jgi:hypothetical protein
MPELKDGLILTQSKLAAGNFTHNGKHIELKQDENNPLLFSAQETLTKEEKEAGNQEFAFYLNFGESEATVRKVLSPSQLDKDPAFKDLTDSEKITKLNSIKHQFGSEPTDVGAGLDEVLQKSVKTPQQNENFAENKPKPTQKKKQNNDDEEDKVNIADIKKIEETHSKKSEEPATNDFPGGSTVKVFNK